VGALLHEDQFPAVIAHGHQLTVIIPVKKFLARPLATSAGQHGQQVVPVEMYFIGLITD
jgi:hypothetical protein